MGKRSGELTLEEWINQINAAQGVDTLFYSDEFVRKMTKKAFKDLVYRNTFNRLCNIILKMFKWTLPDTFNQRSLETGLLWRAWTCAFKKPGYGTFCLPCAPSNVWTIYGEPTQVRAIGYNGYQEPVDILQDFETPLPVGMEKNNTPTKNVGVVMRDNDRGYPYINYVNEYAYKIADKIIALNIATQRLKSPFQYVVDEKELKDTIEQLADKIESNDDVIIRLKTNKVGTDKENSVRLEPNTMRPEIIKAIKESILFDFNMFLETIGINTNPTPDKSQYVNDEELGSNNSLIDLSRDIRFLNRKKFCEDAKKIGVKMSVEINIDEMMEHVNKFKKEVEGNDKVDKE